MKKIIAIDGPAASGKTTLGKLLARKFNYLFFDTGVMYRAVTLAVINAEISVSDKAACSSLADRIKIEVLPPSEEDGRSNDLLIDGVDCTWEIVKPEVVACVSEISAIPGVRAALTAKQREIGLQGNVVMVGRDIGTVVLPEAGVKIYLNASAEERARRRYDERAARGEPVDFTELLKVIKHRDEIDSNREVAPLAAADDAYILESDGKDAEMVFEEAMEAIKERTSM